MLEPIKYATISQICVRDLVFYDEENSKKLLEFCKTNHITYLPSKDRMRCYKLENESFKPLNTIPENIQCHPYDMIFEETTLDKFTNGNHDEVMFVMEQGLIKGVVHIVDYNSSNLYVEIFRLLLNFEKNIRKLLVDSNKTNEDVLNYFKYKSKNNSHFKEKLEKYTSDKGQTQLANVNEFEAFYLRDLMMFLKHTKLVDNSKIDLDSITHLRNWVAHSQEIIKINPDTDHPIYNIAGLKKFVVNVQAFFKAYDHLEMKLIENSSNFV